MRGDTRHRQKNIMNIDAFKQLRDHAELSPYKGKLKKPDLRASGDNPLCGDTISIDLRLVKGKVKEAKFIHQGCVLSGAAASALLEYAKGKELEKIQNLAPEKMFKLLGVDVSPARVPCALLALAVLRSGKTHS